MPHYKLFPGYTGRKSSVRATVLMSCRDYMLSTQKNWSSIQDRISELSVNSRRYRTSRSLTAEAQKRLKDTATGPNLADIGHLLQLGQMSWLNPPVGSSWPRFPCSAETQGHQLPHSTPQIRSMIHDVKAQQAPDARLGALLSRLETDTKLKWEKILSSRESVIKVQSTKAWCRAWFRWI